ncbi:MAG: dTDP-glucose 4,6-dehydratase [Candidatus Ancaeobacter aquaticus]|nr:dTDP-glucose 4,6-dehydratase [Candidatus Ancaeobacter aquaticus]
MNNKRVLVTGGAGFIGANFVHYVLGKYKNIHVINFDKLTYAGNMDNLKSVSKDSRHTFVKGDIANEKDVKKVFSRGIDIVVNFAAETHVDRSIGDPSDFIKTDMMGVYNLLEQAKIRGIEKFIQISTDEVYGSIAKGSATEESPLLPSNPYSASKSGGDRLAYSYWATYNVPVIITRASNNYGPYQYPEKFISLFVTNAIEDVPLPLYGDGKNVRDWLYVLDHCDGIDFVIKKGKNGEIYNIGGGNEKQNREVVDTILKTLKKPSSLIRHVSDRLGHDRRYSLSINKIKKLGWKPKKRFEEGIKETVMWYNDNQWWWKKIKSGEFKKYYKKMYGKRIKEASSK